VDTCESMPTMASTKRDAFSSVMRYFITMTPRTISRGLTCTLHVMSEGKRQGRRRSTAKHVTLAASRQ
jgi:hypothetical protein